MVDLVLACAAAALAVAVVLLISAFLDLHRRHRALRHELQRIHRDREAIEARKQFRSITNFRPDPVA